jgi:hypothetical protein
MTQLEAKNDLSPVASSRGGGGDCGVVGAMVAINFRCFGELKENAN